MLSGGEISDPQEHDNCGDGVLRSWNRSMRYDVGQDFECRGTSLWDRETSTFRKQKHGMCEKRVTNLDALEDWRRRVFCLVFVMLMMRVSKVC
jgi:hypothetical protein